MEHHKNGLTPKEIAQKMKITDWVVYDAKKRSKLKNPKRPKKAN